MIDPDDSREQVDEEVLITELDTRLEFSMPAIDSDWDDDYNSSNCVNNYECGKGSNGSSCNNVNRCC